MNYYYLPEKFHNQHRTCWELVSQIEEFLLDENYLCLIAQAFKIDESELNLFEECNNDPYLFLERSNRLDDRDGFIIMMVLRALIMDFCYFMQEALTCSCKMRLVVAYTLLRRPLVDDMKILLRLLYDSDFIGNFINKENYDPTHMKDDTLKDLLKTTDENHLISSIKGDDIYYLVFSKENSGSILNLSNKAIHPITTRNKANMTGSMNLNFMFANPDNIEQLWQSFYAYLMPILIFYSELLNTCVWSYFDNQLDKELFAKRYEKMSELFLKTTIK